MNRNQPLGTCGISRDELTSAGVVRPAVTLDSIKLDARHTGCPIVIQHVTGRWLVVMPGGAVLGAGGTPLGAFEAEHTAWESCDTDYQVEIGKVVAA